MSYVGVKRIIMINKIENGFELIYKNQVLISHTQDNPGIFIGDKNIDINMNKGEFKIKDKTKYIKADFVEIKGQMIIFESFELEVIESKYLTLKTHNLDHPIRFRLPSNKEEKVYGLGEHFTSLNLRGHKVKNWVEEHITRNQIYSKIIRRLLKLKPRKYGFEKYKTYFIVPSFISTNNYFCHVNSDGYGLFNFKKEDYHEVSFTSKVKEITFGKEDSLEQISSSLCKFHGITPKLPDWVHDGMILGLQGGTKTVNDLALDLVDKGARINGIWSQDFCGELFTYFGKQVMWNWKTDDSLYPELDEHIKKWKEIGINFLGYVNPYLNETQEMFSEALEKDYLVKDTEGNPFLTQATSFKFGIVDLTNDEAYYWFKEVIKTNYIQKSIMGWMADFGEYLPTKCVLKNGNGEDLHNTWPDLWIKLNREALEETNNVSNILFFNRAGYKDNSKYTTLIWNGDQHVDFTDDFGIKSAVRAALSLSFSGIGVSHSDVGGYTTVPGVKRSKELYLRWLELNTFTPVLRSHEGNKPWVNIQPNSDEDTINATVKFSNLHANLKPYIIETENEYLKKGTPMMRPTMFYSDIQSDNTFYFGRDIYVVPVLDKRKKKLIVEVPEDNMIHMFTSKKYNKGIYVIETPIGTPCVLYKEESKYKDLFETIGQ